MHFGSNSGRIIKAQPPAPALPGERLEVTQPPTSWDTQWGGLSPLTALHHLLGLQEGGSTGNAVTQPRSSPPSALQTTPSPWVPLFLNVRPRCSSRAKRLQPGILLENGLHLLVLR